jgi:acetyl esterase
VVGDSVEGNMAATVIILSKEHESPTILFQILFYPVTNARLIVSYEQYQEGYFLT